MGSGPDIGARRWARWLELGRSALTGAAATLADLAVIALLVGALGVSARVANLPALLVGAAVQFVGNRHFAFAGAPGSLRRQLVLFTLAEVVALTLNGVLYDLVARQIALGAVGAVLLRVLVSGAVFIGWSYPVWRRIFCGATHCLR